MYVEDMGNSFIGCDFWIGKMLESKFSKVLLAKILIYTKIATCFLGANMTNLCAFLSSQYENVGNNLISSGWFDVVTEDHPHYATLHWLEEGLLLKLKWGTQVSKVLRANQILGVMEGWAILILIIISDCLRIHIEWLSLLCQRSHVMLQNGDLNGC